MVMLTGALLALTILVEAGAPSPRAADDERIRCESSDGRMNRCEAGLQEGDQVEIVRQLSRSECIRYRSWGVTDGAIWTARGCRAEFFVMRAKNSERREKQGAAAPQPSLITCESSGWREVCIVDTRGGVRLHQQLSSRSPCVHGKSWGYEPGAIWVMFGCRAQFEILPAPKQSLWRRIFRRDERAQGVSKQVRCESQVGQQQRCSIPVVDVKLIRQLSGVTCAINRNWGWDQTGIWVKDGCSADFEVR